MKLVSSLDQIATNLLIFDGYRQSANEFHSAYYKKRLSLGRIFVYGVLDGRFIFAPSRFAGYANCTAEKHQAFPGKDGSITTRAINGHLDSAIKNAKAEKAYLALCQQIGGTPSGIDRKYWHIKLRADFSPDIIFGGEAGYPDEVETFVEGATKHVIVNAYERSGKARSACLSHHGYSCAVCSFNFAAKFGEVGKAFMHVHHLTPISSNSKAREVDPVNELRPVCPNCHAMLHKSDPPFSIEELQELIQETESMHEEPNP
jgi:5-methylcytosine-specific restriction enzyme A